MTKSAREQRDGAEPAKVVEDAPGKGGSPRRMLVSSPLEIDAVVRRIPEGRVLTLGELRANLAGNHKADLTCPTTTPQFLRIVALAADEERAAGQAGTAPYWRVIHDDGTMIAT